MLALPVWADDPIYRLQSEAHESGQPLAVRWGPDPSMYSSWTNHSNRLIPVYTFGTAGKGAGIDLTSYTGENSLYRNPEAIRHLYRAESEGSYNPDAEYMDQTDIFRLQLAALEAKKKYIILIVFDGMDWDTTRAASIWNLGRVAYDKGRGAGTHFQEYQADGTTQFGFMVTSPHSDGTQLDVNTQRVLNPRGGLGGGYDPLQGGATPWDEPAEIRYLIADKNLTGIRHAYVDSATSASAMTTGIKSYNKAINVDPAGNQRATIAHHAQAAGYRVGVATSVPISHATPAAAYAHNVSRNDCQDLARDMLGLPSISHPEQPLPGMDVVISAGWGLDEPKDKAQGENYEPNNPYLAHSDLKKADVKNGGKYVVAQRTPGRPGPEVLREGVAAAIENDHRFLGFFGVAYKGTYDSGHLPFASADGDFRPANCVGGECLYHEEDIIENPTLADMTTAALDLLSAKGEPFWLMVEAGDVDWANHANNLDASIGAVNSGDAAVKVVTDWIEKHSNWDEAVVIVTADHGHLMVIENPELLVHERPQSTDPATGPLVPHGPGSKNKPSAKTPAAE